MGYGEIRRNKITHSCSRGWGVCITFLKKNESGGVILRGFFRNVPGIRGKCCFSDQKKFGFVIYNCIFARTIFEGKI